MAYTKKNPEYVPQNIKPNIYFLKIRLQCVSIALHLITRLLGLKKLQNIITLDYIYILHG